MATLEERVQALEREHKRLQVIEQEHTQLKKTIELQTIAIRALVAKEAFEKLQETVEKSQEQNSKIFDALIMHDRLTNEQLVELRSQQAALGGKFDRQQTETYQQITELDGKIVGLQTEVRQLGKQTEARFEQIDTRFEQIDTRFDRIETLLAQVIERLP